MEESAPNYQESSSSESEKEEAIAELEAQAKELRLQRARAKAKLTISKNKQQSSQQQRTATQSEIEKETKNLQKVKQNLGDKSLTPQQKQKLQSNKEKGEVKITELKKQLEKIEEAEKKEIEKQEEAEKEIQEKNKQLDKIEQKQPQITAKKFEKELKKEEKKIARDKQEIIQQQWEQIKKSEEKIFEDKPELPPTLEKIQEKAQEITQANQAQAAPQKSMSIYMLYLIIFLLEYIVYKKQGITGLIILNIILGIAYYYKDTILQYKKYWDKYFLIIGYILGNVLAYSAPEQEKYKVPVLVGYNAILLAIYGYTSWQNKKETETKKEELVQLQEELVEEIIQKEEEYLDRLQETQEVLERIKEKTKSNSQVDFAILSQGIGSIFHDEKDVEQAQKIYQKIKQQFARDERKDYLDSPAAEQLLKMLTKAQAEKIELTPEEEEFLTNWQAKQATEKVKEISLAIEKIPNVPEEQKKILTKLMALLSQEQIISIITKSLYCQFFENAQEKLTLTYPYLLPEQKLKFFNSGLEALQINTLEKKKELLSIYNTLIAEGKSFDLSVKEKEDILRLLTNQSSPEQLRTFEKYGVPIYNATGWRITSKHKNSLLKLAEDLITLDEEQKENLAQTDSGRLSKLSLSSQQENILKTLAPLQKEYLYSKNLLEKTQSLNLNSSSLNFLVQQEIIPDLNISFRETKDPYQSLKQEILTKNQKQVRQEIQTQEKRTKNQEIEAVRNSLLPSLMKFAQQHHLNNLSSYQFRLSKETFQEEEDWVSVKAITSQQRDFLFTLGFKLTPRYYFFDLLLFVVENLGQDYQAEENNSSVVEIWKNIDSKFTEELVKSWIKHGFNYEECEEWIDIGLGVNDAGDAFWLKNVIKVSPEWVSDEGYDKWEFWRFLDESEKITNKISKEFKLTLSDEKLNEKEGMKKFINFLNNYRTNDEKIKLILKMMIKDFKTTFLKSSNFDYFLEKNFYLELEWEKYLDILTKNQAQELQRKAKFLNSLAGKSGNITNTPTNITHLEEKFEKLADSYERIKSYLENKEQSLNNQETPISEPQPSKNPEPSPYDELLSDLDKEEQERLRKKKVREEAKKKLVEAEIARRQATLGEQERKIKEEEARRQREKELEEQEEKAARERQVIREKTLTEERQKFLEKEEQRITEEKRRNEEKLDQQKKEIELAEKARQEEIEKIKRENEQEEMRLQREREDMERRLQEELKAADARDTERQRRIEEDYRRRMLDVNEKIKEQKAKHETELNKKRTEAQEETRKAQAQLEAIKKEEQMLKEEAEKKTKAAQESARRIYNKKIKDNQLEDYRKMLWSYIENYYWSDKEARSGTTNPQMTDWGYLKDWLSIHPNIKFNLFQGNSKEYQSTNFSGNYGKAMKIFFALASDRFVNQYEFKELLNERVKELDWLDKQKF